MKVLNCSHSSYSDQAAKLNVFIRVISPINLLVLKSYSYILIFRMGSNKMSRFPCFHFQFKQPALDC